MNGHIEEVGGSFAIKVDGEVVAVRPDLESAEKCLLDIYLFRKDSDGEDSQP